MWGGMWGYMLVFILGAVTGALIAWLSFFIAVYPYFKCLASENSRLKTENAMLRDAVDSWKRQCDYEKNMVSLGADE